MQKFLSLFKSKKIFKLGAAVLLLVVPLYPKFPIIFVPKTHVAIRAEDFIIGALSVWLIYYIAKNDYKKFLKNKIVQAAIFFTLAGLLSTINAVFVGKSAVSHLSFLHWARRIEYMIPFFVGYYALTTTKKIKFFAETTFVATAFIFLYGLGQIYARFPVISTQNEEYAKGLALRWIPGARLHSTFAGHYDLAAYLVLTLPVAFALIFHYKQKLHRLLILICVILPGVWLMLKTEARVSFIALIVSISSTLWLTKQKKFILPFSIALILGATLFTGLGLRYKYSIETYWQKVIQKQKINFAIRHVNAQTEDSSTQKRIRSKSQEQEDKIPSIFEDRSTAIRLNVEWPRALRAFVKNPLLGTGYSSITLATDNDYLRMLGEIGLLGTSCFFLLVLRILQSALTSIRTTADTAKKLFIYGFLGGFIGLLLNATFIDIFEASKVAIIFWTLAGLAVGSAIDIRKHVKV